MTVGKLMVGQQDIKFVPTYLKAFHTAEELTQTFPVWTVDAAGRSSPYRSMQSGTRLVVLELKQGTPHDRVKVMTPQGEHVWCLSCHLVEVTDEAG